MERTNASPEYLTPLYSNELMWGTMQNVEYGNCWFCSWPQQVYPLGVPDLFLMPQQTVVRD
jgi:hypothetical protein